MCPYKGRALSDRIQSDRTRRETWRSHFDLLNYKSPVGLFGKITTAIMYAQQTIFQITYVDFGLISPFMLCDQYSAGDYQYIGEHIMQLKSARES